MNELHVTLCILAGGEGRRMMLPKAQLLIRDRPILEHLARQLAWRGPTLLVTAPGRENPPGAAHFDREVSDAVSGEGPLRGVLTALENLTTEFALIATVDMPGIGRDQMRFLMGVIGSHQAVLLQREGHVEPFPSIFGRGSVEIVRPRLQSNDCSVVGLAEDRSVVLIEAPSAWPSEVWTNLNTPEDHARFVARIEEPSPRPSP